MASFPDPASAKLLSNARRQTHHAAQFATAAGISFLPKQADDSHTNLEWLSGLGGLASRVVPTHDPFRIAIRVADLELCVLDGKSGVVESFALNGHTIKDAEAWLRDRVVERGAPGAKFTLAKHYVIPHHSVDDGGAFDASDSRAFAELSAWLSVGAAALDRSRENNGGSEVRCWPHHFDIATLIEIEPGKTVGVGLEPGDNYYDEPYFYVNTYPSPAADAVKASLDGNGSWHTEEWIGAVLPGSRITGGEGQITQFLDSAVSACRRIVAGAPAA